MLSIVLMYILEKTNEKMKTFWFEVNVCVPQPGPYYLAIVDPAGGSYTGLTVEYMNAIIMHRQYMD